MNGNKSVTANFTLNTYTLSTSATNGTITLNPPGGVYPNGTVVTVTAITNSGYTFGSWSGNLTGSVNPTNLTMTGNKSVTANFALIPTYTLATSATNGSIALNPPGGIYPTGTIITNTATPDPGYSFAGWSGSLTGSTSPATIVMDGNKAITAAFALKPLVAAISPLGSGAGLEISASNLEPAWVYELQAKTALTLPWDNVSGSLRSNVTVAVWTNTPLPGEPAKFFRVLKRD
jgi:uncharacterized repeat protein (TIGR02543 family)